MDRPFKSNGVFRKHNGVGAAKRNVGIWIEPSDLVNDSLNIWKRMGVAANADDIKCILIKLFIELSVA